MLAIEIWFGETLAVLRWRAMERAHPELRLASGRLLSSCAKVQTFLLRQSETL